jgi:hypothetical protein
LAEEGLCEMSEIILSAVIGFLLVERYFNGRVIAKQHKDLLRLIKAKSLDEVTQAELVDKVAPVKEEKTDPDLVLAEQMDDETFNKMIKEQNGSN